MAQPAQPRFEVIEEAADQPAVDPPRELGLLLLGLKTLSQRALSAVADLFFLATVASAFWLWCVTPHPDSYQLTSLSIYAAFVLAANWLVRRK